MAAEPSDTSAGHENDRNRPSLFTLLTCWWRPATTAPRLAAVKLRYACLIHLLAGLAFFFGFLLLAQIDAWAGGEDANIFRELGREFERDWAGAWLAAGLTVLSIEGGFVILALIMLPWGAVDERLRRSWAHALRFTWLHTTHALALLLVIGPAIVGLSHVSRAYYRTHQEPASRTDYPQPPSFPVGAPPGSRAMKDYQAAMEVYVQEVERIENAWWLDYENWRRTQPFFVQHGEAIIGLLCTAGFAWLLWSLFRATGSRRTPATLERPPMCEFCGYNLSGTAIDSRCPECGTPAIESLGPDVRPGTGWDRRAGLRAWRRCAMDAICHPGRLGRQIQVTTQPRGFRLFCWSLILPAALVGAAAVPVCYVLIWQRNPLTYDFNVLTTGLPITAACSGAGMLMIAMLVAAVVGMIQTWLNKRNMLPAAAQMASYLSLVFLAGGLFMAATFATFCALITRNWFINWVMAGTIYPGLVVFCLLVLPQLVWLTICSVFVWKGTAAARYANK